MLAGSRERFFDRLIHEYGDFVHYRGLVDFYLVNHPSLVKRVLQETHSAFDKNSSLYDRFRRSFGGGLVVAEGEAWKKRRGLIQQLMGPKSVEAYFQLMLDSAASAAERWRAHAEKATLFRVDHEMDRLTLEIVGRSLFNDGFDHARESIARWTKTIDHYSSKAPLPIVRSAWFPSTLNYRLKSTLRQFHGFIQRMIDDRRCGGAPPDLLSLLCEPRENGQPLLSDEEVRDEALGMIIGGHETSSTALTWAWYELSKNPEVEKKLHNEVDTVLGDTPPSPEQLRDLVYTRMVIDETLRLHPPFWFENRNVSRPVELGKVVLPKGATVAFSRYSLHRHPDFWKEPERFDPQRFEPGNEENPRSAYACVPFGGGPRVCVGVHFAVQELVLLLATLARRFRVLVDESYNGESLALLTLRPKGGLSARVVER